MVLSLVLTFSVILKDHFKTQASLRVTFSKCSCACLSLKEDMGGEGKLIFPVALVPSLELQAPDTGCRLRALVGLLRAT